ncbi:hypothetical protein Salmuc_02173 [Salipiger mucosus DSM 16094]|uniref:Fido domain-containing protein n=1 Tax=Salipiger mucosus DSM 16094 TaxID=1123237 RepID=S9S027_9RHOB|nr:hypothetical protein Salmuc_02173 [Salipiger mucosus DSM 16094]
MRIGGPETGQRVAEADRALARLSTQTRAGSAFALTRILERQEAVSSSSIEGTNSTLDALLELEEDGDGDEDAKETRGVTLALDHGLAEIRDRRHDAFEVPMVLELHRRLAADMAGFRGTPGVLRTEVVWIGGHGRDPSTSTWNPPPPDDVPACIEDNMAYMRAEPEDISQIAVIVRAAVAHAHFEAVHPFQDGNGRIGRLMLPLAFAADGHAPLYLSPWIEAHKTDYYEALKSAQQRLDHGPIIDLLARAVIGTEQEFNATVAAVDAVEEEWRTRFRLRRNSTAERALHLLKAYPVLRARTLADRLGVSFKAASDGLSRLEVLGVVEEKTGYARNRIFVATRLLRILSRPFGATPD